MKCKFCNKEIEDGSLFCGYCGKKQPQVKLCIKCGKEIDVNDTFCCYCGASQSESIHEQNNPINISENQIQKITDNEMTGVREHKLGSLDNQTKNLNDNSNLEKNESVKTEVITDSKPSKTRKWFWVIGTIVLIILVSGITGYYFSATNRVEEACSNDSIDSDTTSIDLIEEHSESMEHVEQSVISQADLIGVWDVDGGNHGRQLCIINKDGKGYFIDVCLPGIIDEEEGAELTYTNQQMFKWEMSNNVLKIKTTSSEVILYPLCSTGPQNGDDCMQKNWRKIDGVYSIDPDGWVNIREEANSSSKIVGKLYNDGEPALLIHKEKSNWVKVYLHNTIGYIHASRVKFKEISF